jgi:Ala-tRNA(Pro) deacylase
VGECYGLETIVDRSIDAQPEIYLEGGDHEILVHMNKEEFSKLMAGAVHSSFSAHD